MHRLAAASLALAALALSASAAAGTGVCDATPASPQACIDAIQAANGVVNDVFKDTNGKTADQLPVFGKLIDNWPNCPDPLTATACGGQSFPPYDCPGQYTCNAVPGTFANASTYVNALDRLWFQPCRLANPALDPNGCPQVTAGCIADGVGGSYLPWEGLVFDLGGPSNKVAIFAENDHGPQPCESLEYTVYLTDNPYATDLIADPVSNGVDPQKWNRAVLTTIFTKGFVEVRPPDVVGHAACGDTDKYSVEEDSFAQVFALPCGITFRYASIIAGNDGLDFPACGYDSQEAELDAVAGLTETGAGVCPDVDGDHYVDCNCPGAPPVCDCDDGNPAVHPGAPEACDAGDLDCDGVPGACKGDLVCFTSLCIAKCPGGEADCPVGSTCQATPSGKLCVPTDCTNGGCPPGGVCKDGVCVPACDDVVCPGKLVCEDGACIDACANIVCPMGQTCQGGTCVSPCGCFAGDSGCTLQPGTVCDKGNTDLCVPPACKGVVCPMDQSCDDATGMCVDFCGGDVKCPVGQKCDPLKLGCVPLCDGVMCDPGLTCDPTSGDCKDTSCDGITCFAPEVCVMGMCVNQGAGGGGVGGGATSTAASTGTGGAPTGTHDPGDTGTCGCSVPGGEDAAPPLAALALAIALTVSRRRRSAA